MALLILSYDESIKEYDGVDFREVLIEFFLEIEPDCRLSSPVSSTIYIKTQRIFPLFHWNLDLLNRFNADFEGHFYFTLAEVKEASTGTGAYRRRQKPKPSVFTNFRQKFFKIKRRLSSGE